jgi:acetoin utilization deacetylase AcuC-like enzyme
VSEAAVPDRKRYAVVYSEKYVVDIGPHVFPVAKYLMVVERLIAGGAIGREEIIEPPAAERADLLLVHTPEYVDDLLGARWTFRTMRSELPLTPEIAHGSILAAGGTALAAREAVARKGFGIHIGGGFHHTFPDHAEGFCYVNDLAVAIRVLQRDGSIRKAAVVDCDVHQGNGTARIFRGDQSVFTFSIHQENNYPPKEQSDLDVGLLDGATDDEYMAALGRVIPARLDAFGPDLVLYVAGADPYREDLLGGLGLTKEGLARRDDLVIGYCAARSIPIASVLAGGYARNTDDTVEIHVATCRKMLEAARQCQKNRAGE